MLDLIDHGHALAHGGRAVLPEHLGECGLHGRGFEGAEHGEQHLHGGDGYDMEARGGEDDGARQHEHGGDGVERHHDGAVVDAIGQHASERGEQDGRHDGDGQHRGEDGG